jgi:hypothetical protein
MVAPGGETAEARLTAITLAAMAAGGAAALVGASAAAKAACAVVYLSAGLPTALAAGRSLWRDRVLDIDLLMIVAALAAAAVGAPLEGAVLLTLFTLSTMLEHRAMARARRAVEALMALRPDTALVRRGDAVEEVPAATLAPGDIVILRPGARVPVYGTILSAQAFVFIDEKARAAWAYPPICPPFARRYPPERPAQEGRSCESGGRAAPHGRPCRGGRPATSARASARARAFYIAPKIYSPALRCADASQTPPAPPWRALRLGAWVT